jgi:hypothetical protein
MPLMVRPKKGRKIAFAILGTPPALQKQKRKKRDQQIPLLPSSY